MKKTMIRKNALHLANRLFLLLALFALAVPWPAQIARAGDPTPDVPAPGSPALGFPPTGPVTSAGDRAPWAVLSPADDYEFHVYLPLVLNGSSSGWMGVNPQNRDESRRFYNNNYANQPNVPAGWNGSYTSCAPGTTSVVFRESVLKRINYYRHMAGIPPVAFSDNSNRLAQAAAYLMSVNKDLDHTPPPAWQCYSQDGYDGASSSNLALGAYGSEAIDLYMLDWVGGSSNAALGHRRWILFPWTRLMGTGDIPGGSGYPPSNALRVLGDLTWTERPETREAFVAWPPPGYVPRPVVFAAWSFSYPQANFANAAVTMTSGGANVPVQLLPITNGYGDNTLAWAPQIQPGGSADSSYQVTIEDVLIAGQPQAFNYTVTLFTP